jgi:hypothetical protein
VVSDELLEGAIGTLSEERLNRIYSHLADWIRGTQVLSSSNDNEISEDDTPQDGN